MSFRTVTNQHRKGSKGAKHLPEFIKLIKSCCKRERCSYRTSVCCNVVLWVDTNRNFFSLILQEVIQVTYFELNITMYYLKYLPLIYNY